MTKAPTKPAKTTTQARGESSPGLGWSDTGKEVCKFTPGEEHLNSFEECYSQSVKIGAFEAVAAD